jgi:hypothetical protein
MSSIQTNRDLYVALTHLGERHKSSGRSLEEYLRALWQLVSAVGTQSSFMPDEFLDLLSTAFHVPPPPFDEAWRSRYPAKSTHVSAEYLAAKFGIAGTSKPTIQTLRVHNLGALCPPADCRLEGDGRTRQLERPDAVSRDRFAARRAMVQLCALRFSRDETRGCVGRALSMQAGDQYACANRRSAGRLTAAKAHGNSC